MVLARLASRALWLWLALFAVGALIAPPARAQIIPPTTQNITAADSASTSTTGANSIAFYTGTPTTSSSATLALTGQAAVAILITGTWEATLQFEASADNGTTWVSLPVQQFGSYTTLTNLVVAVSGTTGDGVFSVSTAGLTNVRVRATAYTSGTAAVKIQSGTPPPTWPAQAVAGGLVVNSANLLSQDESTFTFGSSNMSVIGCTYNSSITDLSSGQAGAAQCTTDRMLFANLGKVGGSTIALGQTTMSASLPVVIANNQSAVPVALNSTPSLANGNGEVPTQGGAVLSSSNGGYQNILQGDAALTASNPLPAEQTDGAGNVLGTSTHPVQVSVANTGSNSTAISEQSTPGTSGGLSGYHLAGGSAASTNATNVKSSAGQVYYILAQNPTTSIAYLRVYNTSSSPTCSSSTGVVHDYAIGAANATGQANGFSLQIPTGEAYATGISFCLTGALGDTDTTNAPAGVTVDIGYK